jgi:hypothetical protein
MRSPRLRLGALALAGLIAPPAASLAASRTDGITALPDPTVHVTPDRIAEIPFYLQSCSDAKACLAPIALYTRNGRPLTDTAPAASLASLNDGTSFPGLRLTAAAWHTLRRTHRLLTHLMLALPTGGTELLGLETLLLPASGQAPWCSGIQRLAPPCNGPFR